MLEEKVKELEKIVSAKNSTSLETFKCDNFYDCPLCEECSIEKILFEIHLAKIHNVQDGCDCDRCIKCTFKKVSDSEDFFCFICEKDFKIRTAINTISNFSMGVLMLVESV